MEPRPTLDYATPAKPRRANGSRAAFVTFLLCVLAVAGGATVATFARGNGGLEVFGIVLVGVGVVGAGILPAIVSVALSRNRDAEPDDPGATRRVSSSE